MRLGARPLVLFRPRGQKSPNRVVLHVAKGDPQVPLIECAGIEPLLPQMPGTATARIEIEGVAAMGAAHGDRERGRFGRRGDKVYVIVHQAVSKNSEAGLFRVGGEHVEIRATISVGEENALAIYAALGDVVRAANGHGAGKTSHRWYSVRLRQFLTSCHVSLFE